MKNWSSSSILIKEASASRIPAIWPGNSLKQANLLNATMNRSTLGSKSSKIVLNKYKVTKRGKSKATLKQISYNDSMRKTIMKQSNISTTNQFPVILQRKSFLRVKSKNSTPRKYIGDLSLGLQLNQTESNLNCSNRKDSTTPSKENPITLLNCTSRNNKLFVSLTNLLKRKLLSNNHPHKISYRDGEKVVRNKQGFSLTQGMNLRQKLSSEVKLRCIPQSKFTINKLKTNESVNSLTIPNESSLQSMINLMKDLKLAVKPLFSRGLRERKVKFGEKMMNRELTRYLKACNKTELDIIDKLNDSTLEQTTTNIKLSKKLIKNSTYRIFNNNNLVSTIKREANRRNSGTTQHGLFSNLEKKSVRNAKLMEEIEECEGANEDLSISHTDIDKAKEIIRVTENEELFLFPLLKSEVIISSIKLAVYDINLI